MTTGLRARVGNLSPQQQRALQRLLSGEPTTSPRKRLCAYVVPSDCRALCSIELREWLSPKLPDYMVPESFTQIDVLPRTANGKLDARRLPEPEIREDSANDIVAPRNDVERALARIWADVLGLDVVSVHDDFFEVGGDSIASIQVVSRAKQANILLEPKHFVAGPTIAELAEVSYEIGKLDSVLKSRENEDNAEAVPTRYVFRLDGLGSRVQYYEVSDAGSEVPKITAANAIRMDTTYTRPTTLEEVATDYLKAVREIQPAGPYMFVAMACGSHVTYETAQQLLRLGEEVSLLAMVEAPPPLRSRSVERKYLKKAGLYIRRGNVRGLIQGLRLTVQRRSRFRLKPQAGAGSQEFNHGLAINNYLPVTYPGKIVVFQSSQFRAEHHGEENVRLWSDLAGGGIDVDIVEGDYPLDVFDEQYVAHLVKRLAAKTSA